MIGLVRETLLVLVASGLIACGGDPEIVGDWFRCKVPDCSTLDDAGGRFGTDGKVAELQGPAGTWTPPANYCALTATNKVGTYEWDPDTKIVRMQTESGETQLMTFTITGLNRARATGSSGDGMTDYRRMDPSRGETLFAGACSTP